MNIGFRPVTSQDMDKFPLWYRRIEGSQLFTHFIPSTFTAFDRMDDLLWFIVLLDDEEIGTLWFERKDKNKPAYDLSIYLNRVEWFGRGIGSAAIRSAIDTILCGKNVKELYLDVRNENLRAIRCYARIGFKTVQTGEKSTGTGTIHYQRMQLAL